MTTLIPLANPNGNLDLRGWERYVVQVDEAPNGLAWILWLHPELVTKSNAPGTIKVSMNDVVTLGEHKVVSTLIDTLSNYVDAYILRNGGIGLLPPPPNLATISPVTVSAQGSQVVATITPPSATMFEGWAIADLKACQSYLKNISNHSDDAALEQEWYIGIGTNCVGCMSTDERPNIEHLRSKFHAANRLKITRAKLHEAFAMSERWATKELHANAPAWPDTQPIDLKIYTEDRPTPVEGYRGYFLQLTQEGAKLKGAAQHVWESPKLEGLCHPNDKPLDQARQDCINHIIMGTHNAASVRRLGISQHSMDMNRELGTVYTATTTYNGSWVAPRTIKVTDTNPNYYDLSWRECRCGIYGFNTIQKMMNDDPNFTIITKAVGYGTVLVDDKDNFRASDAIITEIWIRRDMALKKMGIDPTLTVSHYMDWHKIMKELANQYQCPVTLANDDIADINRAIELDTIGAGFLNEPNREWPDEISKGD